MIRLVPYGTLLSFVGINVLRITSGKEWYEMSVALAKIITGNKLEELLESFNFEYVILQSIPLIHIGKFDELKKELGGGFNLRTFGNGRVFSEDLEIRWRKRGEDEFYTLVISDKEERLNGYETKELKDTGRDSFHLWGEKAEDRWYELRIPKGWNYPVKSKYAKIKVVEYEVEGKSEEGKFYRFCGFEGVDK
jgi:hypothetical protein